MYVYNDYMYIDFLIIALNLVNRNFKTVYFLLFFKQSLFIYFWPFFKCLILICFIKGVLKGGCSHTFISIFSSFFGFDFFVVEIFQINAIFSHISQSSLASICLVKSFVIYTKVTFVKITCISTCFINLCC